MPTKILFSNGEPNEILLEGAISNDARLVTNSGLPAGVHDRFSDYQKRYEATVYLLGVLGTTVVLCDETRRGAEIGLLNVECITHTSPRLEMEA